MISLLRLPKWNDVLVEIHRSPEKHRYCQKLNRRLRASLSHIRAIVKSLAKKGLIKIISRKRSKQIILTEKGKQIATRLQEIRSLLL